jgi:hypothetical protein
MILRNSIIRFRWSDNSNFTDITPSVQMLRGAVAKHFRNNDLFHQHNGDGSLIYRYPRIQYRWDNPKYSDKSGYIGDGMLVAYGDGVEALTELFISDFNELELGQQRVVPVETTCEMRKCTIEISNKLYEYYFRSPWLPLKQEKYEHFKTLTAKAQQLELNRILCGNILTATRDLGLNFDSTVYTWFMEKKRMRCRYKDLQLQGFTGKFITNVKLPDDFALGSKVAHGYGWLKTITN